MQSTKRFVIKKKGGEEARNHDLSLRHIVIIARVMSLLSFHTPRPPNSSQLHCLEGTLKSRELIADFPFQYKMYQVNTFYTFHLTQCCFSIHAVKIKFKKYSTKRKKSVLNSEITLKNFYRMCKRYNYNNVNTHMYEFPIAVTQYHKPSYLRNPVH